MHKKILIAVGITILFLGTCIIPSVAIDTVKESSSPISNGRTLYVGGGGLNNYTKIQDAINNASDGDTVYVYDDSSPYYENVYVDTSINLIGEDKYSTIIDGNGIGDVIYIATGFVNISSFTINNSGLLYSGIEIRTNYNIITNNIISNNYQGLYLYQSLSNIISNNSILNSWVGINLELFSDNNTIIGNQVTNNNFGIILCPTKNVDILKNNISNNFEIGICLSYQIINDDIYCSDENTIQKNNFFNNGQHAFFIAGSKNSWNQNFWSRVRLFPKIIYGLIVVDFFYSLELYPFIPWISIDWNPAKEPYNI